MAQQAQGKLFIVSGPSGVGKTTIVVKFLEQYQKMYNIQRVVTYTTKRSRPHEVHGVDYHFVSPVEFQEKNSQNFFIEYSQDYGALYGTPASVLDDIALGFSRILVIDRMGAMQILKKHPSAVLIWIKISSWNLLGQRLRLRNSDSLDQIEKRLLLARKEIEEEESLKLYHHYIYNDDLDRALDQFIKIVQSHQIF